MEPRLVLVVRVPLNRKIKTCDELRKLREPQRLRKSIKQDSRNLGCFKTHKVPPQMIKAVAAC